MEWYLGIGAIPCQLLLENLLYSFILMHASVSYHKEPPLRRRDGMSSCVSSCKVVLHCKSSSVVPGGRDL